MTRFASRISASLSDPVLVRENGSYLYTFTSVVDDIAFGITAVIRGNDHVTNTATQIQIFEALGAKAPAFAHLPLLVDAAGEGLSKRLGSLSISQMRADGLEPMAINASATAPPYCSHTSAQLRPAAPRCQQSSVTIVPKQAPRMVPVAVGRASSAAVAPESAMLSIASWVTPRSTVLTTRLVVRLPLGMVATVGGTAT